MIHRIAGLALLVFVAAPQAFACPQPSDNVLFHSCWGQGRLAVYLLPEDVPMHEPVTEGQRLTVTGAYTSREARGDGLPKPVGLFARDGVVINPNLGRMDGVLVVDPVNGQPELHHRERLSLGGRNFDLTKLDQRREFIGEASEHRLSVMQSHLLIVDGQVDVRPQEDAPAFVRRMLFIDNSGFGLFQTNWPETLHDAAMKLAVELAPRMALNLDMGSYDYCQRAEDGAESSCGALGHDETGKLSNLLVLTLE